jgi:hypothetical protein
MKRFRCTLTSNEHGCGYGKARGQSVAGGESSPIPTSFQNTFLVDVSPDGTSLLISSFADNDVADVS